jgi:hypothetical protein
LTQFTALLDKSGRALMAEGFQSARLGRRRLAPANRIAEPLIPVLEARQGGPMLGDGLGFAEFLCGLGYASMQRLEHGQRLGPELLRCGLDTGQSRDGALAFFDDVVAQGILLPLAERLLHALGCALELVLAVGDVARGILRHKPEFLQKFRPLAGHWPAS